MTRDDIDTAARVQEAVRDLRAAVQVANRRLVDLVTGEEPSEERATDTEPTLAHGRGYSAIGLVNPVRSLNVGSALRSASCFGAAFIAIAGMRAVSAPTDTMRTWRHTPVHRVGSIVDALPYECSLVAIEVVEGARWLSDFTHPERAMYVFGPENGSIPHDVLDRADHVIRIPAGCLNLGVATAVTLYDRASKRKEASR